MEFIHFSDNEFFEEYKHLDIICSEIFSCKNGISEYIAQMEKDSSLGKYRVTSWDSDYKMLKHIRWARNQIAHNTDSFQISEPNDLEFTRDFYNRIFTENDSLTLLRKANEEYEKRIRQRKKQIKKQTLVNNNSSFAYSHPSDMPHSNKSNKRLGILIGIGLLVLVIIILCLQKIT